MKRMLHRLLSSLVWWMLRFPRMKVLGQRVLTNFPRLRGLVLRLIHGGPLFRTDSCPVNDFDTRSERQQRLLEDLQRRWGRDQP